MEKWLWHLGEGSLRTEQFKPSLDCLRPCLGTTDAHHNKKASHNCVPTVSASEHKVPSCWCSFGWFGRCGPAEGHCWGITEAGLWVSEPSPLPVCLRFEVWALRATEPPAPSSRLPFITYEDGILHLLLIRRTLERFSFFKSHFYIVSFSFSSFVKKLV